MRNTRDKEGKERKGTEYGGAEEETKIIIEITGERAGELLTQYMNNGKGAEQFVYLALEFMN